MRRGYEILVEAEGDVGGWISRVGVAVAAVVAVVDNLRQRLRIMCQMLTPWPMAQYHVLMNIVSGIGTQGDGFS